MAYIHIRSLYSYYNLLCQISQRSRLKRDFCADVAPTHIHPQLRVCMGPTSKSEPIFSEINRDHFQRKKIE